MVGGAAEPVTFDAVVSRRRPSGLSAAGTMPVADGTPPKASTPASDQPTPPAPIAQTDAPSGVVTRSRTVPNWVLNCEDGAVVPAVFCHVVAFPVVPADTAVASLANATWVDSPGRYPLSLEA